jgi:hypothetical protein
MGKGQSSSGMGKGQSSSGMGTFVDLSNKQSNLEEN